MTVSCSLPTALCPDAVSAVESTAALQVARGSLPPVAIDIVPMTECGTIHGAPADYDLCAARSIPGDRNATGGGDALASVTYRGDGGPSFLYLYWRMYPSGRGPITAIALTRWPSWRWSAAEAPTVDSLPADTRAEFEALPAGTVLVACNSSEAHYPDDVIPEVKPGWAMAHPGWRILVHGYCVDNPSEVRSFVPQHVP